MILNGNLIDKRMTQNQNQNLETHTAQNEIKNEQHLDGELKGHINTFKSC